MNKVAIQTLFTVAITLLQWHCAQSIAAEQTAAETPATYIANYQASANGIRATAKRSLAKLDDGSYELAHELQAVVLGQEIARLDQRSRFYYSGNTLTTENYSYTLSGISSDLRNITFDWKAGTALSVEDDESWTLELETEVYDPLSHQFMMNQQLLHDRSLAYSQSYEYKLVDGDEIESHLYEFAGEEILETPLGKLNTIKFQRVRNTGSSRSTTIWLAPEWEFLLARIEQTDGSLQIVLELADADIGGKVVSAITGSP